MTLDASTDIAITGSNVFSLTNTGTGYSFRVNDEAGYATPFVVDASGNVNIGDVMIFNAVGELNFDAGFFYFRKTDQLQLLQGLLPCCCH